MPYPNVSIQTGHHNRLVAWADVYWYDFSTPTSGQFTFAGPHPCLVLSDCTQVLPATVVVAPLSSIQHIRSQYIFHVPVTCNACPWLDNDSFIKIDQLYCIDRARLIDEHYIGTMPQHLMTTVYAALIRSLNFQAANPSP